MWHLQESLYPSMEEDTDENVPRATIHQHTNDEGYQYSTHSDDDFDKAHAMILEEEDATRIQAELEWYQDLAMRLQQDFNGYDEDLKEARLSFLVSAALDAAAAKTLSRCEEAYTRILEEEEAVRVQAEVESDFRADFMAEREFDENGGLFHVLDSDHDEMIETRIDWYDWAPTYDDAHFEARIRSTLAELSNSRFQSQLCKSCRTVRWSAFAQPVTLNEIHLVYETQGSPLTLRKSRCELCRLLGRVGYRKMSSTDSQDGKLEFKISTCEWHRFETNVLVLSLGTELQQALITFHSTIDSKVWSPRISDPEVIDYDALRKGFNICRSSHGRACRPGPGIKLPNFKVIDCYSRRVIPAPAGCKYVALSYVWGDHKPSEIWPVTVEDSLRVTKNMGFRYLWVDQCCIDQENESEKSGLIRHMDDIYSKAQLTIIAAAGKDPHHGLPGVGSRARNLQHGARIGNMRFMHVMCPGQDFEKSSWWTRAWTYQEGVLSKRKLVFTDYQVFYVCNKMHSAENLNTNVGSAAYKNTRKLLSPDSFNEMLLSNGNKSYVSYLRDISARSLTCPNDALNTCLGILRATNTKHLWGIPVTIEYIPEKYTIALCWRHEVTAKRRDIFPSWSWIDWEKGVNFQDSIARGSSVTVSVGNDQQHWQTLCQYITSGQAAKCAGKENAPRLLKLTGFALDSALLSYQWPDIEDFGTGVAIQKDDRPRPRFSLSLDGRSVLCILYMDEEMGAEQLCDVIAFGVQTESETKSCRISALLLKPHGDFYIRVGMVVFTCDDLCCRKPCGTDGFWRQAARQRTVIVK